MITWGNKFEEKIFDEKQAPMVKLTRSFTISKSFDKNESTFVGLQRGASIFKVPT